MKQDTETEQKENQREPVAVIDIGSSAVRLIVAEIGPQSHIGYLEKLQKPVRFGKDVFSTGRISSVAMREGVDILKNFKSVIDTYGITKVQAIATNAVREAINRDTFIDQVFMRTGIDVEVLESTEKNRLDMIALEYAFAGSPDVRKKDCLIIGVGTGSTEIIIIGKGRVELTKTIPIGALRVYEEIVNEKTDPVVLKHLLKRSILNVSTSLGKKDIFSRIDTFIAEGRDMRFVSKQLNSSDRKGFSVIKKKDFMEFIGSLSELSTEEIAEEYSLSYSEADMLYPSLQLYANFLIETGADEIIVPMTSMIDGLLLEISQMAYGDRLTDLSRQVTNSAVSLGRKYHFDEDHALCVTKLALRLFELLKDDHGLGPRERMLLEVSGILHDIGMYIAATSHHKHSKYVVDNSEIFGLRKNDKVIVSNAVRYHRRSPPKRTHVPYMSLTRLDRTIVSKLSAILRVADALDRSHHQRTKDLILEKDADTYTLWIADDAGDLSIERQGLLDKGNMFTDVFGSALVLKQGRPVAP